MKEQENWSKSTPNRFPKSMNKSLRIQPWSPSCPLWCSCRPLNHQLLIKGPKNRSQCPKKNPQNLKKRSISAVNLFNESSISVINLFNKHAYQQSTYQQVTEGAGGRGEALRYIYIYIYIYREGEREREIYVYNISEFLLLAFMVPYAPHGHGSKS